MYGYIYKTTSLIDGRIYIGQKKADHFLGRRYLGSGKHLGEAFKKYGKHNFDVELIEEVDSIERMDEREIYWISFYNATDDTIGYNISSGGNVNRTMVGEHNPRYGHHMTEEEKARQKEGFERAKILRGGKKKYRSEEAKAKTSASLMGHAVSEEARAKLGEYNLNRISITNGEINKTVSPDKLDEWLAKGFMLGTIKKVCMSNGTEETKVPREKKEEYESLGYIVIPKCKNVPKDNKSPRSFKGELNPMYGVHRYGELNPNYGIKRAWVTNGIENKCIRREQLDDFLKQGFRKGRMRCHGDA